MLKAVSEAQKMQKTYMKCSQIIWEITFLLTLFNIIDLWLCKRRQVQIKSINNNIYVSVTKKKKNKQQSIRFRYKKKGQTIKMVLQNKRNGRLVKVQLQ